MNRMIPILLLILLLTGCTLTQVMDGDGMVNSYQQIDQETAKKMMEADDGHVIVDVRRKDEFDAGHIPGAVLIPNESISDTRPEQLPDLDQIILIYCRSGNRSKQAAQKLFDMGYTNVYEFGGINTWTGEIVTGGESVPIEGNMRTYYEMSDGTWMCENYTYQYRLEIGGRMPNAARDTVFKFFSNIEEISFEQAYMAAGISSHSEDYFSPEEAVLVDMS